MYHRLKSSADMILTPAFRQLNTLDTILRQNHPQMLAINRAIAEATEESHLSMLQSFLPFLERNPAVA